MITTVYLHSSKEPMADIADELGLTGEAFKFFLFTLYEVKFTLEVNIEDGTCKVVEINTGNQIFKEYLCQPK